jgi:hypothetical protein
MFFQMEFQCADYVQNLTIEQYRCLRSNQAVSQHLVETHQIFSIDNYKEDIPSKLDLCSDMCSLE